MKDSAVMLTQRSRSTDSGLVLCLYSSSKAKPGGSEILILIDVKGEGCLPELRYEMTLQCLELLMKRPAVDKAAQVP